MQWLWMIVACTANYNHLVIVYNNRTIEPHNLTNYSVFPLPQYNQKNLK